MKGAILCDDGSLGKSIEAMLIITQRWYEGKRRILIIVTTPLLHQWTKVIDSRFSVPLFSVDNNLVFNEQIEDGNGNPFDQDAVVITTYDFATGKAEYISQLSWDLTVFEEAHHLRRIYTGDQRDAGSNERLRARRLKDATEPAHCETLREGIHHLHQQQNLLPVERYLRRCHHRLRYP